MSLLQCLPTAFRGASGPGCVDGSDFPHKDGNETSALARCTEKLGQTEHVLSIGHVLFFPVLVFFNYYYFCYNEIKYINYLSIYMHFHI